MASQRAQKSETHETTEDASSSPASAARTSRPRRGKPAGRRTGAAPARSTRPRRSPDQDIPGEIGGGPGASDASSGGGAGAGIPGGGTDMRSGGSIAKGNVKQDRARIFPEAPRGDANRPEDESAFGGPVRIETDERGRIKE